MGAGIRTGGNTARRSRSSTSQRTPPSSCPRRPNRVPSSGSGRGRRSCTGPGPGPERWCCLLLLRRCPRVPPGRSPWSRWLPLRPTRRSRSPAPSRSVRSPPPRSPPPPPPRRDPPIRETPTVSASSPRSTRPPSWNNLHRHTASDPSPSPRGGWGGNADQTCKSHCVDTCDGRHHSTFTLIFPFFLSRLLFFVGRRNIPLRLKSPLCHPARSL